MTRESNAASTAAAASSVARINTLVELDFSGGVVRLCDGVRDVVYDGDTFQAVGSLGTISGITEDRTVTSAGITLQLSGISSTILSATLDEEYHNRSALIYTQFVDANNAPLDDPILQWSGFMDTMTCTGARDTFAVTLQCESRAVMQDGHLVLRSNESQVEKFAGDTFFQFLSNLGNVQIVWGGKNVSAGPPTTPPSGDRILP